MSESNLGGDTLEHPLNSDFEIAPLQGHVFGMVFDAFYSLGDPVSIDHLI